MVGGLTALFCGHVLDLKKSYRAIKNPAIDRVLLSGMDHLSDLLKFQVISSAIASTYMFQF
jgi:hypothetical protein